MTEIELHQGNQPTTVLTEQMDYARAVSTAALLPQAYRGKPADIMLAVGLGSAMGLTPAESLYRIDVIQGKPTASAELIAANVRKAGHRLRVRGDDSSCTATVIRSDDPEFEFAVTRDVAWAQAMGLTSKDNYKKQPGTMLQWRAITAVARLACPEALYGVAYTADEMGDVPTVRTGGLASALASQVTVEQVPYEPVTTNEPVTAATQHDNASITAGQLKTLQTLLKTVGIHDRDEALAYYARVTGRDVDSSKALSKYEATAVIDDLGACERGEVNHVDPATDEPALDLGDGAA